MKKLLLASVVLTIATSVFAQDPIPPLPPIAGSNRELPFQLSQKAYDERLNKLDATGIAECASSEVAVVNGEMKFSDGKKVTGVAWAKNDPDSPGEFIGINPKRHCVGSIHTNMGDNDMWFSIEFKNENKNDIWITVVVGSN